MLDVSLHNRICACAYEIGQIGLVACRTEIKCKPASLPSLAVPCFIVSTHSHLQTAALPGSEAGGPGHQLGRRLTYHASCVAGGRPAGDLALQHKRHLSSKEHHRQKDTSQENSAESASIAGKERPWGGRRTSVPGGPSTAREASSVVCTATPFTCRRRPAAVRAASPRRGSCPHAVARPPPAHPARARPKQRTRIPEGAAPPALRAQPAQTEGRTGKAAARVGTDRVTHGRRRAAPPGRAGPSREGIGEGGGGGTVKITSPGNIPPLASAEPPGASFFTTRAPPACRRIIPTPHCRPRRAVPPTAPQINHRAPRGHRCGAGGATGAGCRLRTKPGTDSEQYLEMDPERSRVGLGADCDCAPGKQTRNRLGTGSLADTRNGPKAGPAAGGG